MQAIQKALSEIKSYPGRFEIKALGSHYMIDDTYNANPESMRVGLLYLKKMKEEQGFKTAAILGDMFELGEKSKPCHEELGKLLGQTHIDEFYALGPLSKYSVQTAQVQFKKHYLQHIDIIDDFMKRLDQPTLVLVKGSRGMKMERVAIALAEQLKNLE